MLWSFFHKKIQGLYDGENVKELLKAEKCVTFLLRFLFHHSFLRLQAIQYHFIYNVVHSVNTEVIFLNVLFVLLYSLSTVHYCYPGGSFSCIAS